jgi:uncharacterized Rmd1/YagE family protein
MTHLILTDDEREVLTDILETEISDLRMEIMDTDTVAYKETLKNRERILKHILLVLQQANQPAAA